MTTSLASAWGRAIGVNTSRATSPSGFNAEELTPKYPDFISERVYALSDATRWWHEYGKEVLLLNNV